MQGDHTRMRAIQSRRSGKQAKKKIVTLTRKFPARKAKEDWWGGAS